MHLTVQGATLCEAVSIRDHHRQVICFIVAPMTLDCGNNARR